MKNIVGYVRIIKLSACTTPNGYFFVQGLFKHHGALTFNKCSGQNATLKTNKKFILLSPLPYYIT